MRVAVAGATGRIGRRIVELLGARGHEVVSMSRSLGVDVYTGKGLDEALRGVDSVVDCTSTTGGIEPLELFVTGTRNLFAAEQRAGVGHHVLLSIAALRAPAANPHLAGKLAQEAEVGKGAVPWTIVGATQFHDFPAMVASWTETDGTATVPPLVIQPIAPTDVAAFLADVVVGRGPFGARVEVAGPEKLDLVEMARRTYAARGRKIRLVPKAWPGMETEGMLPGPDAHVMPTTIR